MRTCFSLALAGLLFYGCAGKRDPGPTPNPLPASHCFYSGPYGYTVKADANNGPGCPDLASTRIADFSFNVSATQLSADETIAGGFQGDGGTGTYLFAGAGLGTYDPASCTANVSWKTPNERLDGCPATTTHVATFDTWGSASGTIQIVSTCKAGGGTSLSCNYTATAPQAPGE